MLTFRNRQTAVSLFSSIGECWVYPTMSAALEDLGATFIRYKVGPFFHAPRSGVGYEALLARSRGETHHFVMRDDHGNALSIEDFAHLLPGPNPLAGHRWARWNIPQWNGEGPVPGTGRHANYNYHRHPRTMAERRANQPRAVEREDGEVGARAKRSPRNVPNSYDDLQRFRQRSWKAFRKTQYKDVANMA